MADLKDNELIFSSLDPAKGIGAEIARVPYHTAEVPHWSLAPDGTRIAMVETGRETNEIQILNLEDSGVTTLPVRGWKWKCLTSVG